MRAMTVAVTILLMLTGMTLSGVTSVAGVANNEAFERTWARTDRPVQDGMIDRTWIWGPEPFTEVFDEAYDDSPTGGRIIQYYDKSRMEITQPAADPTSPWYVTNGLLVVELASGRMQLGDDTFVEVEPAEINVAGDPGGVATATYAFFGRHATDPPLDDGASVIQRVTATQEIVEDAGLARFGVVAAYRVQVPGIHHQVASVFWEFMTASGLIWDEGGYNTEPLFQSPFYATGFPISEAYWVTVQVGGQPRDVLAQCFERRCLTYTPGNPEGWQVEAGNVGQHYFAWRYEQHREQYAMTGPWNRHPEGIPLPGEGSSLERPRGIAVSRDTDLVYVTDNARDRIVAFSRDGIYVAGWGETGADDGQFQEPNGIAIDAAGSIYVADTGNRRIQVFDASGAHVATWTSVWFQEPIDIAVSPTGIVHVLDQRANRIWRFAADGTMLEPIGTAGSGPGQIRDATGIAIDGNDNIYIADAGNNRVQQLDPQGQMIREWVGIADSPPGTPNDVAVDDAGRLYVTDRATGQVHVYDGSGNWRSSFGQYLKYLGTESEQPIATWVDVDRHGDIWVATEDADSPPMWMSLGGGVVRHSNDGRVLDYWFSSSRGILGNPTEVHVDPSGNVIVSSDWDRWLHVYGPDGTYLTGWGRTGPDGTRFQTFGDFAVGPDGDVWVAGRDGITVTRFTQPYGTPKDEWIVREPQDQHEAWSLRLTIADDGSVLLATRESLLRFSEDGELLREWSWPEAVVEVIEVDSHADRLYALVGRLGEPFRSVLIYDLDGELMDEWLRWTSADEGGFGSTSDLAVGSDGAVYFADTNVNGIIVCNADGSFRTIAGEMDYQNGFWMGPTGVTVDRFGNLYAIESPKGLLKLVWLP